VKDHAGVPGNERADALAGKATEVQGPIAPYSLAFLKLEVSEAYNTSKESWLTYHSSEEILLLKRAVWTEPVTPYCDPLLHPTLL
jgi:hypothetical protein